MSDDDYEDPTEPVLGIFTDVGDATPKPPKWIIKDFLPIGLAFVVAPPKGGKSTIVMAAASLVCGFGCRALPDFMSQVESPGPVVYWSFEADAGEVRDILEQGLKVVVVNDGSFLIADDPWLFRLDDEDGLDKLLFWLDEIKPKFAILDPFRDFHGLEEKDSGDMIRLLRPLRKWAMENECCLMIVHHTKKREDGGAGGYDNNDIRGSSAIFGAADCILVLSPRGTQTEIRATFKRAKSWTRTITVAAYDLAGQPAGEALTEIDRLVIGGIKLGAQNMGLLASQIKSSKSKVLESCERLERNGYVFKRDNKWVVK